MTELLTGLGIIAILAGLAWSVYEGGLRPCNDYKLMPDRTEEQ